MISITRSARGLIWAAGAMMLVVWPSPAQQVKGVLDNLDNLVFSRPELRVVETNEDAQFLKGAMPNAAQVDAFVGAYGPAWSIWTDQRRGRPSLIDGGAIPFIPGHANSLDWEAFAPGCGSNDCLSAARVEKEARAFLERWRDLLGVDPTELVLDPVGSQAVGNSIYFLRFQWAPGGISVEGASVYFRINGGNLLQVSTTKIGDLKLSLAPAISPETAWQSLAGYLGEPVGAEDEVLERGRLLIVPVTPIGANPEQFSGAYGGMADYRLCYRLVFRRTGVIGTWEGLVDAHSGELLRFRDATLYGSVRGTVYMNDGQSNALSMPLAFARTGLSAPNDYADAAGRFTGTATTVTLDEGKYIRIADTCGTTDLTTSNGEADYGQSVGTDCGVPSPNPAGGGNTWASKTLYYHLTEINRKAAAFLPGSTWLRLEHPTVLVNRWSYCNASAWIDELKFYKSSLGCADLGEFPGSGLHEWGHTLDLNDGSGEPGWDAGCPPVETLADWTAALQLRTSCPGAGAMFGTQCSGYGDPCTQCDSFRDLDYMRHDSATPWTAQNHGAIYDCGGAGSYNGPCGWEDHCESGIASQALWDFVNRDLPADCGISGATAWQLAEMLYFSSLPTMNSLYTCTVGSPTVTDGCGGASLYTVMRVLDDSGDGTANGTPHAEAIYHALARHNIACGTEGEAKNQNQSTCPSLSAPVLSASTGSGRAYLSWTTGGPNATRYFVLKNDAGPNRGYTRVATVNAPTRTYTDTMATVGITSYYQVQAVTNLDACTGTVSNVASAIPAACGGVPVLDKDAYGCNQTVTVALDDSTTLSTVYVYAWSTTDTLPVLVTLTETPSGSDHYVGTFQASTTAGPGKVLVANGDVVTVRYIDPDFCGTPSQFTDVSATVDCQGPVISGVVASGVTGTTAKILWVTDEPADSHVQYSPPPASAGDSTTFKTSHSVVLSGLTPCTTYSFDVASLDEWGNGTSDLNHTFTTTPELAPVLIRTPNQTIPDDDPAGAWSTLSVYDGRMIQDLNVGINIQHTRVGDLQFYLKSPDGTEVPLALNVGGTGDNFTGTIFDDESGVDISSGSSPFTGRYRPASPLSAFDGKNANGSWRLTVIDTEPGETGTVVDWSLRPTYAAYDCGFQLDLQSFTPNDTCSGTGAGDGDGMPDPGEDVAIPVTLLNSGSQEAQQISCTLTSTSPWVTITRGSATFPDILPGGQGISYPDHLGFRVNSATPCNTVLEFSLHVECWQDLTGWDQAFTLTVGESTPEGVITLFEEVFGASGWPESTGWVHEIISEEGKGWSRRYDDSCGSAYSLSHQGAYIYPVPADAWAHTPAIALSAGVPYTLSFVQWAEQAGPEGESLSVWLGTSAHSASMTELLWSETGLSDPTCNTRSLVISVPSTGTYYLGFHCSSPPSGGSGVLLLDNIRLAYDQVGSCAMNPCTPCTNPGAPTITMITDPNPCSHGGVRIWFSAGAGAVRHDLYMDGDLVLSDISSGVVYHSGDTIPHDFVVRGVWGSCHTDSEAVEGTDEGSPTPGIPAPVATDWDTCDAGSGLHIAWGAVTDATSYDLEVDGGAVLTGVTSPHIYVSADSSSHSFRVRAKSGNCAGTWSDATAAADEDHTPGTPSAPGIADLDPCALTGVQITWGSVPAAVTYDLYIDATTIVSGVSSPYVRVPGNADSHTYQVRAWSADCKGAWSAVTPGIDTNGMAAPPAPTVTDVDPCAQSGVSVSWAPVPGATAYDLILDGSDVTPDVTSPTLFDPRGTANHDYSIQARAPGCTGDRSNPTTKADQNKSVAVPTAVRANDASPCAASGVTVTWDPVTGATGYDLSVDEKTVIPNVTSPHTYIPGNGDTHAYRVRAKNDSCMSLWSEADDRADENVGVAVPTIIDVTDRDPCALTGVYIRWDPVSGATAYDLLVDGTKEVIGVTSPATYDPGDGASHTYQVRGRSTVCTSNWSAGVACSDINNQPGMPVITSVVDIDPGLSTGIQVNYTSGAGATRHDLYRDGVVVKADYASGATYVPGDSGVHSYRVRAWKETCYAYSSSVQGTDLPQVPPPEIAPGDTSLTAQSWPDKTTHTWPSNTSCSLGYLLYRGTLADLPQLLTSSEESCLRFRGSVVGENTVTGMTEDPSSIPGRFYWYLVTGINGLGEGTAGNATEGPRSMDSSGNCPAP